MERLLMLATLLLFSTALMNTKPSPVFADVFIGAHGPYRFLVDTGAETSLIDQTLAEQLQLQPTFRIEIITQNSSRLLPGLRTGNLHLGPKTLPEVELVFHDLTEARRTDRSVRGLLGANALTGFNFTISPATGHLEIASESPAGEAIPFSYAEGRIAIKVQMGRELLTLILDSGATHVVLFRVPVAMAKTAPIAGNFATLEGARSVVPTCWTAEMLFTEKLHIGTLPAAIVQRKDTKVDGLMPTSVFRKIYVDQTRSELVLVR
jgi:hypothetical protein